jgi:hypothetical protein
MTRVIGVALVMGVGLVLLVLVAHGDPALVAGVRSAATLLHQVRSTHIPQPNWNCLPPQPGWAACAST